jgi:hypothetical protein
VTGSQTDSDRTHLDDLAEEARTIERGDLSGVPLLREYRVTFGQKYAREEHPRWPPAHPGGWVTVVAGSYGEARAWTVREFGIYWCDVYGAETFASNDEDLYPRGELARFRMADTPCSGTVAT